MEKLRVGQVARAHGVRGELRVQLDDVASTALLEAERVWIGGEEHAVAGARTTTGAVLLTVEGIGDRDAAHALRGRAVEVRRDDVPLAEGEFFVADLIGCEVVAEDGTRLGRAVRVLPGPQDLLVIHDEEKRVERLLPVVPAFIVSVDRPARRVVVAPPEDLPEEPLER